MERISVPPSTISNITDIPVLERQGTDVQTHQYRINLALEQNKESPQHTEFDTSLPRFKILRDYVDSDEHAEKILEYLDESSINTLSELESPQECHFSVRRSEHHPSEAGPIVVCYDCSSQFDGRTFSELLSNHYQEQDHSQGGKKEIDEDIVQRIIELIAKTNSSSLDTQPLSIPTGSICPFCGAEDDLLKSARDLDGESCPACPVGTIVESPYHRTL